MARLFRVLVPVTDIDEAETFYAAVLGEPGDRVSPERHYFDCDGTILACYAPGMEEDARVAEPNPEYLYLAVDDLEATYEICQEANASFADESEPGVGAMGEIATRPWGETSFYVKDPFGNPLCFVAAETTFLGS